MSKTKIITAAEMADHYRPLGELYAAFKRIEKLEADNARLRAALDGVLTGSTDIECGERVIYAGAVNAVRAALQETSHD